MKILIIEDSEEIIDILKIYLENDYEIFERKKGLEGLDLLKIIKPEILILDITLPDIDGITLCEKIRANPIKYGDPYIIMLTANKSQDSVIEALKNGADDYIKKPFDGRELLLRVQRVSLRLSGYKNYLEYHDFKINLDTKLAYYTNEEINLTKKEFDLLVFFIENKGIILSREKILDHVWADSGVELSVVNQCLKRLRKKFPILQDFIESRRGFGFRLV